MTRSSLMACFLTAMAVTAASAQTQDIQEIIGEMLQPIPPDGKTAKPGALPKGVVGRLGRTPFQATRGASAVRFLDGGKRLLVHSQQGNPVQMFDAKSGVEQFGQPIVLRGNREAIVVTDNMPFLNGYLAQWSVSRDGTRIARPSQEVYFGSLGLRVDDLPSGKTIFERKDKRGFFTMPRLTADGKRVAALYARRLKVNDESGESGPRYIRVWEVKTGNEVATLAKAETHRKDNPFQPNELLLSPTGKHVIVIGTEGKTNGVVYVWNVDDKKSSWRLPRNAKMVGPVVLSPDGRLLAEFGDKKLRLWNLAQRTKVKDLDCPLNACQALLFSPDGQYLAAAVAETYSLPNARHYVIVLQLATGKTVLRLMEPHYSLLFSPDSKKMAVYNYRTLSLYDVQGRRLQQWQIQNSNANLAMNFGTARHGGGWPMAFSPDGSTLVMPDDDGLLRRWNTTTGKEIANKGTGQDKLMAFDFSPNGKLLVSAGNKGVALWDVRTKALLRTLVRQSGSRPNVNLPVETPNMVARSVRFSPDGKRLAIGWADGTVMMWDIGASKQLWRQKRHSHMAGSLTFAPNKNVLISAGAGGKIFWQQAADGVVVREWKMPELPKDPNYEMPMKPPLVSPDGRLALSHGKGKIKIWELVSGKIRHTLSSPCQSVRFSPDSRRVVLLRDDMTILKDLNADPEPATRSLHASYCQAAAFTARGDTLVLGSYDGSLWLFDPSVGTWLGHREGETNDQQQHNWPIAVSVDGRHIATPGKHGTILLWKTAAIRPAAIPKHTRAGLEKLWRQLAASDGPQASMALAHLIAQPKATAFLQTKLQTLPVIKKTKSPVKSWLERAFSQSSKKPPKKKADPVARTARALELLEHLDTPAARTLLEEIAQRRPHSPWTTSARAALERLRQRTHAVNPKETTPLASFKHKGEPDDLPKAGLARLGIRRFHHATPVTELRAVPGGKTIVTIASNNDTQKTDFSLWSKSGHLLHRHSEKAAKLHEVNVGFPRFRIHGQETLRAFDLSPDGQRLAVPKKSNVKIIDLATSKVVQQIATGKNQIATLRFLADSRHIIVQEQSEKPRLRLFDTTTGKSAVEFQFIKGDPFVVEKFILSRDGRRMLALGRENYSYSGRLWQLPLAAEKKPTPKRIFIAMRQPAAHDFTADGRFLAADAASIGYYGSTGIFVYDLGDGRLRRYINDLKNGLSDIKFSPDGSLLLASDAEKVYLWDTNTWRRRPALAVDSVSSMVFSPDRKSLVLFNSESVHIYDTTTWKQRHRFHNSGRGNIVSPYLRLGEPVTFSPDGQYVFAASEYAVRKWHVATGKEMHAPGTIPVARQLVAGVGGAVLAARGDNTIHVWRGGKGQSIKAHDVRRIRLHAEFQTKTKFTAEVAKYYGKKFNIVNSTPSAMALTPTGKMLIAGYTSGHVVFWDVARGKKLRVLTSHKNSVTTLKISTDGKTLQSADDNQQVIWTDIATGKVLRRSTTPAQETLSPAITQAENYLRYQSKYLEYALPPIPDYPERYHWQRHYYGYGSGALVSPDGRLLVSSQFMETATRDMRWPELSVGTPLAFSPNGRFLAYNISSGGVQMMDVINGRFVRFFGPLTNPAAAVFSPDGRCLAAVGKEGLKLWDTATGNTLAHATGHLGPNTAITFSPGGRYLFTSGVDRTLLVWNVAALLHKPTYSPPTQAEVTKLWNQLQDADAAQAHQALVQLRRHPKTTIALLESQLQPVPKLDAKKVAHWIARLDHPRFRFRAEATKHLAQLGDPVRPALMNALKKNVSLEHHQRINLLLDQLRRGKLTPAQRQALRAVELLDHLDTPAATALLRRLAQGAPGARLTIEALAALRAP